VLVFARLRLDTEILVGEEAMNTQITDIHRQVNTSALKYLLDDFVHVHKCTCQSSRQCSELATDIGRLEMFAADIEGPDRISDVVCQNSFTECFASCS
jgi:hypothetical protein